MWMLALAGAGLAARASAEDDPDAPENTFISPAGKPFRAHQKDPYPVATWFSEADKNRDGKIDHAEFLADAGAFFDVLDQGGKGVLDNFDVQVYERRIAPEILGYRVMLDARLVLPPPPKLWLAQMGGQPDMNIVPEHEDEDPDDQSKTPKTLDESGQGASPYSFFQEPEPVTAADFDADGRITKANFLKLADMHFTTLDKGGAGYLTLASLPKTAIQKQLEKGRFRP